MNISNPKTNRYLSTRYLQKNKKRGNFVLLQHKINVSTMNRLHADLYITNYEERYEKLCDHIKDIHNIDIYNFYMPVTNENNSVEEIKII
jgi:hypothetical protein